MTAMANITRYGSHKHRPSWCVRMQRRTIRVRKRFYDHDYGGKTYALAAAQAYRDEIAAFKPLVLPKGYRNSPHRDCAGVSYTEYYNGRGRVRKFWTASYMEEGKRRTRRFEINGQRSARAAKRMAKEWREQKVAVP